MNGSRDEYWNAFHFGAVQLEEGGLGKGYLRRIGSDTKIGQQRVGRAIALEEKQGSDHLPPGGRAPPLPTWPLWLIYPKAGGSGHKTTKLSVLY